MDVIPPPLPGESLASPTLSCFSSYGSVVDALSLSPVVVDPVAVLSARGVKIRVDTYSSSLSSLEKDAIGLRVVAAEAAAGVEAAFGDATVVAVVEAAAAAAVASCRFWAIRLWALSSDRHKNLTLLIS